MITYEVNKADVRRVQKKLKDLDGKSPRVIKNAINKTARQARKTLAEGAQGSYTVKAGGFNSRMRIRNATVGNLEAEITSKDRTLTLVRFHYAVPKSGGKADVVKAGLKEIVGSKGIKAFKRNGLIMQRRDKERLPVRVLRSNSVPKMLEKVYKGDRGVKGALQPVINKTLHENISAEIAKLV